MVYTIYPIHIPSCTQPDYLIIQYHPCIFVSLHYPPKHSVHITVLFYKANPTASPIRISPRYLESDLHRHRWNHAFATSRWTASQVGHFKCCDVGGLYSVCVLRSWRFVTSIYNSHKHNFRMFTLGKRDFDMDSFLKWLGFVNGTSWDVKPCKIMIDSLVGFQPSSHICSYPTSAALKWIK